MGGKHCAVGSTCFSLCVCGSAGQGKVEVSSTVTPPDRTPRLGADVKPEAAPRTRGSGPNTTSPKPSPQSAKPSLGPRPALPQKPRTGSTRSIGTHSLHTPERSDDFQTRPEYVYVRTSLTRSLSRWFFSRRELGVWRRS